MCMKTYSEYLYIIKFIVSYKSVCEMVWMAAMKLLRINESKINLQQSEITQHTQDIQTHTHTHTHVQAFPLTHICTCAPY